MTSARAGAHGLQADAPIDADVAEMRRLAKAVALRKFLRGEALSFDDACSFWGFTASSDPTVVAQRLEETSGLLRRTLERFDERGSVPDERMPSLSTCYGLFNLHRLMLDRYANELTAMVPAKSAAYEFRVGKTITQMRRKRFDVTALVNGRYVPGMSVSVVEGHNGGSWGVTARIYDGGRGSSREVVYDEGLSRRAAVTLAERVLRAATITHDDRSGNDYVSLPQSMETAHEALPLDRLTNAQAASSWEGNRAPPDSPWISNGHFAIRRSAMGTEQPTHQPGERRFSPWNKTLFKVLERPAASVGHPHPPHDIKPPHNAKRLVPARVLGWADTGGAGRPRVATFVGEDGTVVNANADYVALIERNLNLRAQPFVVGGDYMAGVYWLAGDGSVSALLMPTRGDKPVVSVRENPRPRRRPKQQRRMRP